MTSEVLSKSPEYYEEFNFLTLELWRSFLVLLVLAGFESLHLSIEAMINQELKYSCYVGIPVGNKNTMKNHQNHQR